MYKVCRIDKFIQTESRLESSRGKKERRTAITVKDIGFATRKFWKWVVVTQHREGTW